MLLGRLFPQDTKIDFVGARFFAFAFTGALLLITIGFMVFKGLNLGIDFRGGVRIEVASKKPPITVAQVDQIRDKLNALNLGQVAVQTAGKDNSGLIIRVQRQPGDDGAQQRAFEKVRDALGGPAVFEFRQVEVVGPVVSEGLLRDGIIAVVLALIAIAIYVAFRYEWQFGVAAIIATAHDVVIAVGVYAVFGLDFDLVAIAALMTLAGWSINDTIVVFDRLRENLRKYKKATLSDIINMSINQMLSRTVLTSATAAISVLPMFVFGGEALFNFTLSFMIGIFVGTYSSIYVASSLLLYMPAVRRRGGEADKPKAVDPTVAKA
jgi:preprotein translocase SecF subunit